MTRPTVTQADRAAAASPSRLLGWRNWNCAPPGARRAGLKSGVTGSMRSRSLVNYVLETQARRRLSPRISRRAAQDLPARALTGGGSSHDGRCLFPYRLPAIFLQEHNVCHSELRNSIPTLDKSEHGIRRTDCWTTIQG